MGCTQNKGPPPQTPQNTLKVLCLGIGGCGKSTYMKQMKLLHNVEWDEIELENYKKIIRANIIYGLLDAIEVCKKEKIDISDCKGVSFVNSVRPREVDLEDPKVKEQIRSVFAHSGIQQAMGKYHTQEVTVEPEHLTYFYVNFDRIASEDYIPNNEDILRCRQRTAGISTTLIYMNKKYFEFTDVGGQKPEQHKWIQILEDNTFAAVLFFVAVDEFDVSSSDDPERTKLSVSRRIFGEVCNNNVVEHTTPIILMLNRKDIFHKRIATEGGWEAFKKAFPSFKGQRRDEECLEHIGKTFTKALDSDQKSRVINMHYTCALDTEAMSVVWNTIREAVFQALISRVGFDSNL